ncbi:beta-lactamase [Actinoplanes friuliensis DSM 7358]|uniref:Beta-lactamase n=1 Tax=Actinoplanes friuliensis DSM 7358 TaxID=1246995 RepID=U5W7J7_9ACTN|nr:beta-lactamase [Actinoplanes friuliensis DSM 7358]
MVNADQVASLVRLAGYGPRDPVLVGAQLDDAPPVLLPGGRAPLVYIASLSKQFTAACAALLVRQGRLDVESSLARWMPELPAWAATVRVRHLIHHTSGLSFDEARHAECDRTTAGVLAALDHLDSRPGTEFRYSNAGYVCLATVVERAAGQPLPRFAQDHLFAPLALNDTRYWSGPAPHPPGAAPTDHRHPAPLSLGDGGVWSTTPDLLRWNQALDHDELGISALLHTPGHLDDGTPLDYAWGVGVRTRGNDRIHRHGGSWPGVTAQLVRIPSRRSGFVVLALDNNQDRTAALAEAMLQALTP